METAADAELCLLCYKQTNKRPSYGHKLSIKSPKLKENIAGSKNFFIFRVIEVRPTQVRLMWRPPRDQLDVDAYEVRYFARGGSKNASSQVLITKKESITISGLRDRTNYGFEIRTQTASQDMYLISFSSFLP